MRSKKLAGAIGPVVELIERRVLLSATLGSDGTLAVTGTSGADTIHVKFAVAADHGGTVTVTIGNAAPAAFDAAKVKRVSVDAQGGDDHINVDGQQQVDPTLASHPAFVDMT